MIYSIRRNRSTGSEEDILKEFCYIWTWRPLWSCGPNTSPPTYGGYTQNLTLIDQVVLEMFEHCGRRTPTTDADGRTLEHEYTTSSPGEPEAQVS